MKCLVIIPFASEFDEVYEKLKAAVITARDGRAECRSLKEVKAAGRITDDIIREVFESAFCVADLTGNNPNVMWETGFAMALGKPIVLIGQDVELMPFDLSHHRLLQYRREHLDKLGAELEEAVRQTVKRLGTARLRPLAANLFWLGHDLARAIRLAMHEPQQTVELEKNLLGALHHLEQIQLPDENSRVLILRALNAVCNQADEATSFPAEIVGWIAQAKNDLGELIAETQAGFRPYPTTQERERWIAEAEQ